MQGCVRSCGLHEIKLGRYLPRHVEICKRCGCITLNILEKGEMEMVLLLASSF